MTPARILRIDSIADDASAFLQAFCRQFAPGVVALTTGPAFQLTPLRTGAASISLSVENGDPTVTAEVGREAILEWLVDLETYDASWWAAHVEPLLSAVAAGRISQVLWLQGESLVAVDTEIDIGGRIERFTCRRGFRGLFAWLTNPRGHPALPSQRIDYVPWTLGAV